MRPIEKTAEERAYVEEYIAGVLGTTPFGDVWNVNSVKATRKEKQQRTNRIQNRASKMHAQARRFQKLRNDMTFAATVKKSTERMQFVQTTKSFDDADCEDIRQAQENSIDMLYSSTLMKQVMGTTVNRLEEEEDDDVYYDSDPEDLRLRTRGGVRRASANHSNIIRSNGEDQYTSQPRVLSGAGFENIAVSRKLRRLDEEIIVDLVQVSDIPTSYVISPLLPFYTVCITFV